MKILLIIAIIGFASSLKGQTIKISNPEPRKGQEFIIDFDFGELDTIIDSHLKMSGFQFSRFSDSKISKTIVANDTGEYIILPMSIQINGREYLTKEIKINVLPELAKKEGLIARIVQNDRSYLAIIEEIKLTEWEIYKNNKQGVQTTRFRISKNFHNAELRLNPTPKIQYKFLRSESKPLSEYSGDKKNKDVLVYSLKIYEINCDDMKNYELQANHFINLPDIYKIIMKK